MMNPAQVVTMFLATYERYYSAQAVLERVERKRAMAEIEQRLEQARMDARQAKEMAQHLS